MMGAGAGCVNSAPTRRQCQPARASVTLSEVFRDRDIPMQFTGDPVPQRLGRGRLPVDDEGPSRAPA